MNVKLFKQLALIFLGTFISGFAVINFPMRYGLADSGFSGVNLILYHTIGLEPWIGTIILNAPFVLILYKMFDLKTTLMTLYGVASLTASLAVWRLFDPMLPYLGDDLLIVVLLYGVIVGFGIGIVIKATGTTGGNVLIAKLLNKKFGIPIAKSVFIFDVCVISASLIGFLTFENAIYTLLGLFVSSVVIAKVQEGGLFGYKVLIISDHYEKINKAILLDLQRGSTMLYATGSHSGHDKRILMVVIQKRELSQLKEIIHDIDPSSFVTVTHTYETLGEGFTYAQYTSPKN